LDKNRITKTNVIAVSKTINAPIAFVYGWCTDYQADDTKLTRSKTQRVILQKTPRQVIYLETFRRNGRQMSAVNIVSLNRPIRWHLNYVGQEAEEVGDYRLTRLGPAKTRLDMRFKVRYKIHGAPSKSEETKSTSAVWDKYVTALEKEFAHKKR